MAHFLFSFSIGYPVVTLGFGFKSYVGYRIRQRKQREVAKENEFYMQLLQQALPQEDSATTSAQPEDTSTSLASTDHIINHSISDHLQKELPSTQLSPIHNNQQHNHHSNHHKNAQNSSNNKSLNLSTTSPTSLTSVSSTSTSPATTANGHAHHSSSNGVSQSSHKNNRRSLDKDRSSEGKSAELSNSRNHSAYQQSSYTKETNKTFVTPSEHSSTTPMLFASSSSSSASSLSSVSSKGGVPLAEKDSSSTRNSEKDKQNGAYDYHQQNSVGNKVDTKGSAQTNGGSSGNKNNNSNADGPSHVTSSTNSHNKHNSYTEVNVEAAGKSSLKSNSQNGIVLNVDSDCNNHHQQAPTESTELIEKVKGTVRVCRSVVHQI